LELLGIVENYPCEVSLCLTSFWLKIP